MKTCIYATIDKISGVLGKPFLARNDEDAMKQWLETEKELNKNQIDTKDISIINIAYFRLEAIKNKESKKDEYYPIVTDTLTPYDIFNVNPKTKVRNPITEEENREREEYMKEKERILKNEINKEINEDN